MKKLRLLVTDKCHRNCEGCCNKDWDLESLPVWDTLDGFDTIMFTGGEPLLFPTKLIQSITNLKIIIDKSPKVYVYTSICHPYVFLKVLEKCDGITLTLHDETDVDLFYLLDSCLKDDPTRESKSLRLNIFKGVEVTPKYSGWIIKSEMEWIKNCPLPNDEVFMRFSELW